MKTKAQKYDDAVERNLETATIVFNTDRKLFFAKYGGTSTDVAEIKAFMRTKIGIRKGDTDTDDFLDHWACVTAEANSK